MSMMVLFVMSLIFMVRVFMIFTYILLVLQSLLLLPYCWLWLRLSDFNLSIIIVSILTLFFWYRINLSLYFDLAPNNFGSWLLFAIYCLCCWAIDYWIIIFLAGFLFVWLLLNVQPLFDVIVLFCLFGFLIQFRIVPFNIISTIHHCLFLFHSFFWCLLYFLLLSLLFLLL